MRFWLFGLSILLLTGCATTHWVDAKGRDCKRHWIYPAFTWDSCEEQPTPLATQRLEVEQNVKVDAAVQTKAQ